MSESIHDLKKEEQDNSGSGTYVEFKSDESEAQRKAYRIASRGGQIREGVEDIDELYAILTPKLAEVLFNDNPVPMLRWLDLDQEDWEEYLDELEEDE
ncbi:MAG: hypothetical protein ABEH77_05395 [Halobacteriaceae archaeon]